MKRKMWTIILITILLTSAIFTGIALAKQTNEKGPFGRGHNGPAGKSHIGHLYLVEKNPDTWEVIENGSWGKMKYILKGLEFSFVFNGHKLEANQSYTLIYYPDPWPGNNLICLGNGSTNGNGSTHIKNAVNTSDLPREDDENFLEGGAKIWLVLSSDVDNVSETPHMVGWNPTEYLFEYDLINYVFNLLRNRSWHRVNI